MALNSLAQRVLTAVVLVAALLPAFLFLPKVFGVVLITAFVLGAAWEWAAFAGWNSAMGRAGYVTVTAAVLSVAYAWAPHPGAVLRIAALAMAWWAAAFALVLVFPVRIPRAVAWFCGLLVVVPAWMCMVALLGTDIGGRRLLLVVLAIVWAADVGAYFVGRRFGAVKLAPAVSPGKTWEGVIGGLVCAALAAIAGAIVLGRPVGPAIPLGLSVAAISVVGDLTVSVFKRNAGLKDSGNLFPGHGGVLDRVDSVTAATPLFLLLASWTGWL